MLSHFGARTASCHTKLSVTHFDEILVRSPEMSFRHRTSLWASGDGFLQMEGGGRSGLTLMHHWVRAELFYEYATPRKRAYTPICR